MAHLLREDRLPLPFCGGCASHSVTRMLDRAMESLGLTGLDVCLVTDIGCNGLIDQYFDVLSFHGLHGRSITYATGIKLAKPKLKVIVVMGDGGTGIGGGHLLSAARRDVDITLVIVNNFNYGMTGGQHSATTPIGGFTTTTPGGNLEKPLDICQAVISAGGRFAARTMSSDKGLSSLIARAISFRGFSVVDVIGPCTAYFMPRNNLKRSSELEDLCMRLGWKTGILREDEGEDFGTRYASAARKGGGRGTRQPEAPLDPASQPGLRGRTEIVIAASAGNYVRFAGTALAQAAIDAGGFAVQKDDYPITVRTGYSVTELILSGSPIGYTGADSPDVVAVASEDGLRKTSAMLASLKPGALVIAEEKLGDFAAPAAVRRFPIAEIARTADRSLVAMVSAALISLIAGTVPPGLLRHTISRLGAKAVVESNLKAFDAAVSYIESHPEAAAPHAI